MDFAHFFRAKQQTQPTIRLDIDLGALLIKLDRKCPGTLSIIDVFDNLLLKMTPPDKITLPEQTPGDCVLKNPHLFTLVALGVLDFVFFALPIPISLSRTTVLPFGLSNVYRSDRVTGYSAVRSLASPR